MMRIGFCLIRGRPNPENEVHAMKGDGSSSRPTFLHTKMSLMMKCLKSMPGSACVQQCSSKA